VDLLRNDLGALCEIGSVRTESLFQLHSFSQVHHLISSISGLLPPTCSALQLLQSCFPGGSITGAPKIRAMQIIGELERVPRAFYCGSVFYNDYLDRLDSNICIRTLVAAENQLYCWGGSGVVADSVAELEYQECLDKVSVLMDLPGA
jgi:para-aminobenzoate synthetase component 1